MEEVHALGFVYGVTRCATTNLPVVVIDCESCDWSGEANEVFYPQELNTTVSSCYPGYPAGSIEEHHDEELVRGPGRCKRLELGLRM
ncbi:hypothetical protein GALMADRAFT_237603, partial [Galerina marginata CBS 339.88]